jgi:hypothetical protein
MTLVLLVTLLSAAPLVAAPSVDATASREAPPTTWAVGLKVAVPAASIALLQGANLAWLGGTPSPVGGLSVERAVGRHLTLELGLSFSAARQLSSPSMSSGSVTATPTLHWYPGQAFEGAWLGVALPLSFSASQFTMVQADGTHTLRGRGVTVGADLLLGWSFRWGTRLMASLAAGPTVSVSTSASDLDGLPSQPFVHGGLGVKALLAAGVAL